MLGHFTFILQVENVLAIKSDKYRIDFTNYHDHSKFAFCQPSPAHNGGGGYTCIGDINRQVCALLWISQPSFEAAGVENFPTWAMIIVILCTLISRSKSDKNERHDVRAENWIIALILVPLCYPLSHHFTIGTDQFSIKNSSTPNVNKSSLHFPVEIWSIDADDGGILP